MKIVYFTTICDTQEFRKMSFERFLNFERSKKAIKHLVIIWDYLCHIQFLYAFLLYKKRIKVVYFTLCLKVLKP